MCELFCVCVFRLSCICMKVLHIKFHMQIHAFMLTSTHIHALIYTHRHAHKHTHTQTHTLSHAHTLSLSLSLSHTNTHTMYCTQGHHQFLRLELFIYLFFFLMTVLFSSDFSKTQCKSCMPCEAGHYGNKTGLINCTMCWRGKKNIFVPVFGTLVPDTDNIKYTDS